MSLDVVGIGEILVDFVASKPGSYVDVPGFVKCFGGAPMNCIMGVSKLGSKAGAIAAVGDDPLGEFLVAELERWGVDTSQVKQKRDKRTTITFVANEPGTGERQFLFYRKPWIQETADTALSPEDIDPEYIGKARFLHASGFALSQGSSKKAVLEAILHAREKKVKVSFDPTLRPDVWDSVDSIKATYDTVLRQSDVATFSSEEARFMYKTEDPSKAADEALDHGVEVVGLKLGAKGALIATEDGRRLMAPAFKIRPVDTTGAGDAWNATLLVGLTRAWPLEKTLLLANAVSAMKCTRRGAVAGIPSLKEAEAFIKKRPSIKVSHL